MAFSGYDMIATKKKGWPKIGQPLDLTGVPKGDKCLHKEHYSPVFSGKSGLKQGLD